MPSILTSLTEGQLECLQLVRRRKTAKQIARELGITHHAVEQRLKSARRKIGVETTAELIELLDQAESRAYGRSVYGVADVASSDVFSPSPVLPTNNGGSSDANIMTAFSPAVDARFHDEPAPRSWVEVLLGSAAGWTWQQKLMFMASVALAALLSVSLMVSLIEGLGRIAL